MITSYQTIKYMLDPGAYPPERAHGTDAGADLRTPIDFTLPSWSSRTIDTASSTRIHFFIFIIPCYSSPVSAASGVQFPFSYSAWA